MYQHPVLAEAVMKGRLAHIRDSAVATTQVRAAQRRQNLVAAARHGTGWLLVDLGLKLATPRGGTSHPVGRGQR
jgi:hypothetical protein